jgi:hypothetical protein
VDTEKTLEVYPDQLKELVLFHSVFRATATTVIESLYLFKALSSEP